MNSQVIEALAGTAGGGLLLALVYIAYVSIKNAKNSKITKTEAKNNINISTTASEKESAVDYLISTLQQLNSKIENIQQQLHDLEQKQTRHSTAFKIYVDNNGVEKSVKNAITRILEGD
ncbi:hypothetical protein [Mycoplasma sp. VS403A]|uniref:hypothetical protein n=1 Tax=Mycoplasma sp. VS403A TaxID=3401668 RepID=UPI003AAF224B